MKWLKRRTDSGKISGIDVLHMVESAMAGATVEISGRQEDALRKHLADSMGIELARVPNLNGAIFGESIVKVTQ